MRYSQSVRRPGRYWRVVRGSEQNMGKQLKQKRSVKTLFCVR